MARLLDRLLKRSPYKQGASALYVALVERSRAPEFYLQGGVADTLDGRFDMISLHAVLLIRRIKRGSGDMAKLDRDDLTQQLFDYMFDDMDRSLREMGVGDLTVGKRVKKMASAFYGRASAYEEGLDAFGTDRGILKQALIRNLYRDDAPADQALAAMVEYIGACEARLEQQSLETLARGDVQFPSMPDGTVDEKSVT